MKNRSLTILALLAANQKLSHGEVHRTTLVKQTFLTELIRPLYRVWLQTFSFVRYFYGPYSEDIFHRLDTLIFNGLAKVDVAQRRGARLEARYSITSPGAALVHRLAPLEIKNLTLDLVWALQVIGIEQASTLCKLVYQEAEFSKILALHSAQGVGPETQVPLPSIVDANNETFNSLAVIQKIQRNANTRFEGSDSQASSRDVVLIFLQSLSMKVSRRNASS